MMCWNRVYALILKYVYICSRNSFRAMDVLFWPVMDLLVWGFVTLYMLKVSNAVPGMITFLIGAVIMWNVFYRAQQVVCISKTCGPGICSTYSLPRCRLKSLSRQPMSLD